MTIALLAHLACDKCATCLLPLCFALPAHDLQRRPNHKRNIDRMLA